MGIIETAVSILKSVRKEITQKELVNNISVRTGKAPSSIRGCMTGYDSSHKLFGNTYVRKYWDICKQPSRLVRKSKNNNQELYTIEYDTDNKKVARLRLSKFLKRFKKGNILTMAGENGYCVELFKSINSNFEIFNCEKFNNVLKSYVKKGMVSNNFLGTIGSFLRVTNKKFNFINYDSIGYICDYMYSDFKHINSKKLTNYIAITLEGIRGIRNTGTWANWARRTYKTEDPTLDCVVSVLTNYKLIDNFYYKGSGSKRRVLVFKLRK